MADPKKIIKTTVSKDGTKIRDEYDDGTFSEPRPNPGYKQGDKYSVADEKSRIASTAPNKVVTPEQYEELRNLYTKAKIQGHGPAVLEFQKKYHEYLPHEAMKIIASDPRRTNKAKEVGVTSYDLKGNEDGYFGPRTEQYWQSLGKYEPRKAEPALAKVDTKLPAKAEDTPVAREEFERNPPGDIEPTASHGPWWLQDIVGTAGAAGDFMRIKKYNPWQATPGVTYPTPTFYDPTRELAASAEQTNIGANALAAFTDPQAFNARFSQLQGQGFKNAADIMGRYNNLNVGVSNQFAADNANIANQHSQQKAKLNTDLYDKYMIANQQFDNAKNQARQNLRNMYIHAITNKNYTENLNQIYPQFAVDPSIGGRMFFHDGRNLTGNEPDADYGQMYETALGKYPTAAKDEAGRKLLADMVRARAGMKEDDPFKSKMAALMGYHTDEER